MIVAVDYAEVDGNTPPDWAAAQAACARAGSTLGAAFFRGAWGTAPDPVIGRDWRRAQDAGLVTGAYLFLRMRADQPPEDQVHVFADNVGALTAHDMVPTIDVEDTGMAPEAELAYVHRAWTAMRAIYGAAPMIYTSARVWSEDLHDQPAGEMTDSPLWLAKPWPWDVRSPAYLRDLAFNAGTFDPSVPTPWGRDNWWWHQYQGDAIRLDGFSHTVDLSRFHLMRQGETGFRVAWVQQRLALPVTRTFDRTMAAAVRAFQRSHGLVDDAVIGPRTLAPIAWISTPSAARAA